MVSTTAWETDRIAARKVLAVLGLPPESELIDAAVQVMTQHREQSMEYAAERIQAHIVRQLETEGPQRFIRESEDWARGFNYAEELLITATPADLLEIAPAPPRSKGQLLRTMIRAARKD